MPVKISALSGMLNTVAVSRCYWLLYVTGGLVLLAIALYSQHVDGTQPCTLCIQVRLWISLLIIISFIVMLLRKNVVANLLGQLSVVAISGVLIERSWQLLGNERGFIVGECGFDLGLPAWFQIEDWLPWLYRIETTCGKTPEVIFGITMAEGLVLLSVSVFVASLCILLASSLCLANKRENAGNSAA